MAAGEFSRWRGEPKNPKELGDVVFFDQCLGSWHQPVSFRRCKEGNNNSYNFHPKRNSNKQKSIWMESTLLQKKTFLQIIYPLAFVFLFGDPPGHATEICTASWTGAKLGRTCWGCCCCCWLVGWLEGRSGAFCLGWKWWDVGLSFVLEEVVESQTSIDKYVLIWKSRVSSKDNSLKSTLPETDISPENGWLEY